MAPDERDRSFDKALARHLRADSFLQDSASPSPRDFGRAGKCPGPETLAAYHERSLLPEEMNPWKEHIVGCANCQTILSHLEAKLSDPNMFLCVKADCWWLLSKLEVAAEKCRPRNSCDPSLVRSCGAF